MYVVLPQFIVTALSALIFAIFAPHQSVLGGGHGGGGTLQPPPATESGGDEGDLVPILRLALRAVAEQVEDWDAVGMVFRVGGISAAVSCYICWRMTMERSRGGARGRGR
ncbi:hypothetical protein T439DRAFT_320688 [Meredithblackwellia eburnea MCA 4105]